MKTEILPYKGMEAPISSFEKVKENGYARILFSRGYALILPIAFLLGRASLAGDIMPFGMALYAATLGMDLNRILVAFAVVLGMITGGASEQLYVTIAGMVLFNVFSITMKNKKTGMNFRYAIAAFVSILIPQIVLVYLQGFLMFDFLKAILHAFIVFSLLFIFRNAIGLIDMGYKKRTLSNEEIISAAIVVALTLSGLGNIGVFGFDIKNILCVLLILIFSFQCGSGVGTSIGVTVGLLVSMSTTVSPLIIGSYAFCGLLAGIFRSLGKIGACLGFIMGNAVLTLYLNGSTDAIILLKEIIVAIIIFLIIPKKLLKFVSDTFSSDSAILQDNQNYNIRIKEMTLNKLNKFSKTFKELSKTFNEISETKVVTDKHDISTLFDRVADKVCKDCSLNLHCWERNFYNTYQIMFKIIEKLDSKGWVDENDIPKHFLERCARVHEFVKTVNNVYEIFKVDLVWKNKVGESRELISQQLDGISDVISKLATEIDIDVHFKKDIEDILVTELYKVDIKASDVIVYENKWGKYEINIFHKGCGGKRTCICSIEKLVSQVVGRKMVKEGTECCKDVKDNLCSLRLVEEEIFRVTTGVAKVSKNQGVVSGDSYTFMDTGSGKYVIALSDGMGSGQKAATQSRATISLIEQFMESGFDKDLTVKLINSILVLRSDDDSFTTIDMTVIDLYKAEAEFVKVGAVPTLIKKDDRVEIIKSVTLPAGILCDVETELIHKGLKSGDFIIMISDGVLDSFHMDGEGGSTLIKLVEEIKSINPQEIADIILSNAFQNCNNKPGDDMTVLVAKVWKRT